MKKGDRMSWMMSLAIATGVLMLLSHFSLGVHVASVMAAFWGALMISVVNAIVKPVVSLLTLPLTLLTLGLFSFVVNALMLMLAAALVPGFSVTHFLGALIASALFGFLTGFIRSRLL
jgi:putative membrane protein